jgi:hypothetical protein
MGAAFDPDRFLAETAPHAAGGFDPDAFLRDTAPVTEAPSALRAGAIASFGPFADEVGALGGAVANKLGGGEFDYTKRRDAMRAVQHQAEEAHPRAYLAGEIGAAVPMAFVPGGGELTVGRSLGGALLKGGAQGAFQALGESEADLTKGDVAGAAKDTGIGALAGAAVGAVGHGLGKAVNWVADKASSGIRGAESDAAAKAWATAQKAYRTAKSALGGEAAAGLNAVDQAEKIVANESGHYTPALVAEAAQWLQSPEVAALRQRAAGNVLEAGQNRLPGSLATAEQVFAQAKQGLQPQAVEAAGAASLEQPFKRQIWPRVVNYASRAIPPIVGASVGGIPGAILGFGAGAVMGNPGTSLANAMRNPAVRRAAWQAVQSGAGALGKFGPALQRAAQVGGESLAHALHESLLEADPEYQKAVGNLLENSQGGQ